MRYLTLIFIAFLLFVVFAANRGFADDLFGWVYMFPEGDKVAHFGLMGMLSLLVTLSTPRWRVQVGRWQVPIAPFVVLAVVTLEELSQAFVPGRTLSWGDWFMDVAGIGVGAVIGRMANGARRMGWRKLETEN